MRTILDNAYGIAAINAAKNVIVGDRMDLIKHQLVTGQLSKDVLKEYSQNVFADPEYHCDKQTYVMGFVARAILTNNKEQAKLVAKLCDVDLDDCLPDIRLEIKFNAGAEIVADEPFFFTPFNNIGLLGVRPIRRFRTFKPKPEKITGFMANHR